MQSDITVGPLPGVVICSGYLEIFYGIISSYYIFCIWALYLPAVPDKPENMIDPFVFCLLYLLFLLLLTFSQVVIGIKILHENRNKHIYFYVLIMNTIRCVSFLFLPPFGFLSGYVVYCFYYDKKIRKFYNLTTDGRPAAPKFIQEFKQPKNPNYIYFYNIFL